MQLNVPGMLLISAPCGSGKSHLIRYVMHRLQHSFKVGVAFSNTAFNDGNLDYIDRRYIHPAYNPDIISALMKKQQKDNSQPCFVLFDDLMFDKWHKCDKFLQLCTQYRHYKCYIIIATQYARKLPPTIRSQATEICMFRDTVECSVRGLYDWIGMSYGYFNEFAKILLTLPKHAFLYHQQGLPLTTDATGRPIVTTLTCPAKIPKFSITFKQQSHSNIDEQHPKRSKVQKAIRGIPAKSPRKGQNRSLAADFAWPTRGDVRRRIRC